MDRRKFLSYKIAKDFRERFILPFNHLEIELHILIGNHDTYYKNTNDVNSVNELLLERYKNIHIYSEAQEVVFDGLPILFLPWINANNEIYSLGMVYDTKADICMGHLQISGFAMQKGRVSDVGHKKEEFRKFDSVFSGHYHHKSDDGQIYYLGSPYEIYWNDWNDQKGFHIFDTETKELTRIVNPYTIFSKIYYDDTQENYDNYDVTKHTNQYVKLIVVNKKDLYKFDKFVDRLLKTDCFEVKIIEDFSDLDATNVSDDIVENTEDTMTLLNRYVDDLDVDLNKNRLKNNIRTLYNEAQDLEI